MNRLARFRTVAAVAVTVLILAAATATAAALITGADVKDGSLTGADVKNGSLTGADVEDGSIGSVELGAGLNKAIPFRVTGTLPAKGFSGSNLVENTSDGVTFGPYANGGAAGGSICTSALNGHPLSDVNHLTYVARYVATSDTVAASAFPTSASSSRTTRTMRSSRRTRRRRTRISRKAPSTPGSRRPVGGGTTTTPVWARM